VEGQGGGTRRVWGRGLRCVRGGMGGYSCGTGGNTGRTSQPGRQAAHAGDLQCVPAAAASSHTPGTPPPAAADWTFHTTNATLSANHAYTPTHLLPHGAGCCVWSLATHPVHCPKQQRPGCR
jgi:hypothetical protein